MFRAGGTLYRQVNHTYRSDYDLLMSSGLHDELAGQGLIVAHRDVTTAVEFPKTGGYKVIQPEEVPLISYPYEWCFSQLQDAALATLNIQLVAMRHGLTLKDASAYNIQFRQGRPVLIDTLSFEKYVEGEPWVAYRQYCQHFLAPLALMAHTDVRLLQLMRVYIDGIPLDLAGRLLPLKTRLKPLLAAHLHLHARSQRRYSDQPGQAKGRRLSRFALDGLLSGLAAATKSLRWRPAGTEWGEYYSFTNYTEGSFDEKKQLIGDFLDQAKPSRVCDLGANTGLFSRLASDQGVDTMAFDIDPAAVEKGYRQVKAQSQTHLLPLVLDLTNPSPGLGWANREREPFVERARADMVLALALIHHLAIANNLPFGRVAEFMGQLADWLIIEFVPKDDSQVQKLLASRQDIFSDYSQERFEAEFGRHYDIKQRRPLKDSRRVLYLMKSKRS
ncbi:class I SAM-dependent methyltransferase [Candidatus Parcubacteria bacterium]|nr:class I SAM-dependent methyltransferase [Candidatus Parcubacteria bacterium]